MDDDARTAPDPSDSGEWPPTEQDSAHPASLQALDRVKHLFGRKRE